MVCLIGWGTIISAYDGRVQTMDCPVEHLFDSFNMSQKEKVYAGINSGFQEVIWLYQQKVIVNLTHIWYNYEKELGYLENYLKIM